MKTVKLGDLFNLRNGYTPSKQNKEFWENGTIPWFRMDDIRQNGNILSDSLQHITPEAVKGKLFKANSIIMGTSATIGEHALILNDFLCNQRFTNFEIKDEYKNEVDSKYLYYYFYLIDDWCLNHVNTSSFASVDMNRLKRLDISYPDLDRQKEIVSILDNIENLISLLEKETDLRKKQFEYYLIQIFNNLRKHSQMVQLNKLLDYEQPTKYQVKSTDYDNTFEIPVLTAGDAFILGYTDEIDGIYNSNSDNPVIIFDDFTTGFHWVDFPFKVKSSAMKILKLNSNLNDRNILRFLYFAMKDLNFIPTQHQRQWIGKYSKFYIPYPDEETILKVVNNLNSFTDIISLLEQEIKLRKKQLQYYRNKLLTE